MPFKKAIQRLGPSWSAACLTWLWVAFLHPDVFFRPNSVLLASSRDAVKNVYTLAWQWAHSTPFSPEFGGMGWPFSEHVFYTDGHPLLAWLTGGWLVPGLIPAEWTAGILHVLIIASWGAAAGVLVKIAGHFRVNAWWVPWACSLIPLFHPQALRWTGHYALAYSVALPLSWWLQLRWNERPTWKRSAIQILNLSIWLLTHAYLGAVATAFAGLVGGLHMVFQRKQSVQRWTQLIVTAATPLLLYVGLLTITDGHPFRTDRPYGFWDNVSRWNAALLPSHGPLGAVRRELGWGLTTWEAWGFLGTGTWFFAAGALLFCIWKLWQRQEWVLAPKGLWTGLVAGIVLFAVAVGEPFLTGREAWLEQAKLFQQFRAIGRFTWPAVWAFPIAAIWWVGQRGGRIAPLMLIALFAADAWWMQVEARNQMALQPNPFSAQVEPYESLRRLAETHQAVAIHPVPWFQMGSESVGREGSMMAHRNALAAAFQTGLPVTATHLTRMSITESRALMEWMGHARLPKHALREAIPTEARSRNVLVYACDATETWQADDRRLWSSAAPTSDPLVRLINLDDFFPDEGQSSYHWAIPDSADLRWKPLNDEPFAAALEGGAIRTGRQNEYLLIDTVRPDSSWLHREMEASCWFWHGGNHAGRDALQFEWIAEAEWPNGERHWLEHVPVSSSGDHLRNWTRGSLRFTLHQLPERLYFFAVGFGAERDSIRADAYRIRPVSGAQQ